MWLETIQQKIDSGNTTTELSIPSPTMLICTHQELLHFLKLFQGDDFIPNIANENDFIRGMYRDLGYEAFMVTVSKLSDVIEKRFVGLNEKSLVRLQIPLSIYVFSICALSSKDLVTDGDKLYVHPS